jgi:hypothetical protein
VAPEPVWAQRLEEKSSASVGDRTPVVQSVTILTELPRLLCFRYSMEKPDLCNQFKGIINDFCISIAFHT